MANSTTQKTATVIPLRTQKASRASEKKWGTAVMQLGFTIFPSLIFRAQQRLGLNPTQFAVLLQICDYWWEPGRKPFPSKATLAERLGLSPRQVQRYIAELETAGLLKRIERRAAHRGKLSNEYDLSGLVERLKLIEPDVRKANAAQRAAGRRGGLKYLKLEET
jgi:hypothetical protein